MSWKFIAPLTPLVTLGGRRPWPVIESRRQRNIGTQDDLSIPEGPRKSKRRSENFSTPYPFLPGTERGWTSRQETRRNDPVLCVIIQWIHGRALWDSGQYNSVKRINKEIIYKRTNSWTVQLHLQWPIITKKEREKSSFVKVHSQGILVWFVGKGVDRSEDKTREGKCSCYYRWW